jgi:hypothetical protein
MPFDVFWDLTPIELDYAFKAYVEELEYKERLSWEQVRVNAYYRYLMTPKEKSKHILTLEQFKKRVFPLNFDKPNNEADEIDLDQIASVFNQIEQKEVTTQVVSANELKAMNI